MRQTLLIAGVLALAATPAVAGKSCDELKAEIAAKIEKKGEEGERRVVGTCGGGTQVIVYKRGKAT